MAPTKQELSLLINPLVPEAVQHNNRVRLSRWLPTSSTNLQPPVPLSLYTLPPDIDNIPFLHIPAENPTISIHTIN